MCIAIFINKFRSGLFTWPGFAALLYLSMERLPEERHVMVMAATQKLFNLYGKY